MRNRLIILSWFILFTQSCKKSEVSFIPGKDVQSFNEVFEAFWNGMNANYVYWDIDTTNWNAMYGRYRDLFSGLDMSNYSDLTRSVHYFREMTQGLIDAHYRIQFMVPELMDSVVSPAFYRKAEHPGFHQSISYFSIAEKLLDSGFVKGYDPINNQGHGPLYALSGRIRKNILYFGFSEFYLFRSFHSNAANTVKPVLQYFFDYLSKSSDSLKGVILDVRNNPGGDLSDLNFLVGHLVSQRLSLGYFHTKRGNNPLDFTPWINISIPPLENSLKKNIPLIILADNYSASLSEALVMAICAMPNGKFIGEQTYGATGPITANEVYNAGSFKVGGFLSVETSAAAFRYIDSKSYEDRGFPPDIPIAFNKDSIATGVDQALTRAIEELR